MDHLNNPIYYTAEHRAFADSVKKFVEKEISPNGMRREAFHENFIKKLHP
jgi:hypothetical protein